MQRLNDATLSDFLSEPGVSAVLFGAPDSESTMAQALEFADAWLECHDEAAFGYVDVFRNVTAARTYGVRVLPTTMIVRGGEVIAWIEGRCSSIRTAQAVRSAGRVAAAA
jgi:hypothetical protein